MGKQNKEKQNQDINDIFQAIKKPNVKKNEVQSNNNKEQQKTTQQNSKKNKKIQKQQSEKKKQNFTEEGYKIYKEEDLNLGKGGDTNLCPFDCDCCF